MDNGRSLVVAPSLCTQLLSANQYVQNNKTESLQNSTSAKQQNSVSTQQRNSKTVTSVSQYFSQSVLQSVSTSVSQYFSQSVLTSISQSAFLNKTPPDLPFFVDFVPGVGFGNGWFASSDWPANKRERDVIFDPFLSPRNIICSGLSKLCFPLREIFLVTKTACPQGGGKLLRSRRFLPGPPWPDPKFGLRRIFETPSPENREDPAIFGVEKWRFIAPIRHRSSPFSTDFGRLRMQNFGQNSRIWTCFCALNSSN